MPANIAWTQFMMQAGQVTSPTPVTITATLNGGSASGGPRRPADGAEIAVDHPSIINGGAQPGRS